jgi:hypothetical protein
MDLLEELICNYRMNSLISQKKRFNREPVPTEDCRPFMNAWLQCVDNKDNCCGKGKCKFFFQEWQSCHGYNNGVKEHNRQVNNTVARGTYNGLSAK